MTVKDFFEEVRFNSDLVYVGLKEAPADEDCEFGIKFTPTDSKFLVSVKAIEANEWKDLLSVLTGERSPTIMQHMTRIVGYYSNLRNWNKSKLAELKDRHKGDYDVKE